MNRQNYALQLPHNIDMPLDNKFQFKHFSVLQLLLCKRFVFFAWVGIFGNPAERAQNLGGRKIKGCIIPTFVQG